MLGSSPLTRGKPHREPGGNRTCRLIPAHAGKTGTSDTRARPHWAHPRSRGENTQEQAPASDHAGSSPLTRGKPPRRPGCTRTTRLIPAHAGKTRRLDDVARLVRAHPRSRGENSRVAWMPPEPCGSSPLTRGKRGPREDCNFRRRLIPAHAGKTFRAARIARRHGAHPRSRGENHLSARAFTSAKGSSPLTRGKPCGVNGGAESFGLIPAHAGKTAFARLRHDGEWAHPRSRGENAASITFSFAVRGSSPLTRGKRMSCAATSRTLRLIPAHAGKTDRPRLPGRATPAHPRSRGENIPYQFRPSSEQGSSPLTRGKPCAQVLSSVAPRLIPAHAGKTRGERCRCPRHPAHPRSRGENKITAIAATYVQGSSPLTRGKPMTA